MITNVCHFGCQFVYALITLYRFTWPKIGLLASDPHDYFRGRTSLFLPSGATNPSQ